MEARPEHVTTCLQHQLHHRGLLPRCRHPRRGLGGVAPGGEDGAENGLCLVDGLSQFSAVLGLASCRLEMLGVGLLDVGLEQVQGGPGHKGKVVGVAGGVMLSQHPPGPLQQPQHCIQPVLSNIYTASFLGTSH